MIAVFIRTNVQSKDDECNYLTMIPCRHTSMSELAIFRMIYEQYSEVSVLIKDQFRFASFSEQDSMQNLSLPKRVLDLP